MNAHAPLKIGVFGGTFDPPHLGHLIAAQDACSALSLDRIFFVPAAQPPHKRDVVVTRAELRLEMLEAAVSGNGFFEICSAELQRKGTSYTVDTLLELKARFHHDQLYLLVGVDQVREFSTWHRPAEVRELAEIAMLTRAGGDAVQADFVRHVVEVTRVDVSSTLIRKRVHASQSIRYMVPDAVVEIIERERLYVDPATSRIGVEGRG